MKTFQCDNGLRLTEADLLLYVSRAVDPTDEHYITFLKTFDAIMSLLKGESVSGDVDSVGGATNG